MGSRGHEGLAETAPNGRTVAGVAFSALVFRAFAARPAPGEGARLT
jgi:hypothetical protein